ncbi:N-acetyl sugar amidotransferase [Thalassospira alkalitolerans]|uniref:N-acetyl sugar amidotransferase n=1 Tax=Thalassospira alkalitolerans TaxID=1293890 RepID=UPI0030EB5017
MQIRYCKRCLMPDSRPRIFFDDNGVCNACHTAEEKNNIDWDARRNEFLEYVEKYRRPGAEYDCVVPWSGGKDSSAIAHKLKFEFGLNPLLVTFSPLVANEVGVHNREEMLKLGFDHIMVRPNQRVSRHLARRFFDERGNPKIHWDAGINSAPVQVAVKYNIPLIFYAEHGESEYGGRVLSEEHRKIRDYTEVLEHQIGDDPRNWMDDVVQERDLAPYLYPDLDDVASVGIKAFYFAYFFRWSMYENYQYIADKIDFRLADSGRTNGSFTNYDSLDDKIDDVYYYMQYVKFGFGRAVRDACRLIHNKHITREQGLEYALQYDGEYPTDHLPDALEYLGLDEAEFNRIVDLHRNDEVWKFEGNEWKLRYPLSADIFNR